MRVHLRAAFLCWLACAGVSMAEPIGNTDVPGNVRPENSDTRAYYRTCWLCVSGAAVVLTMLCVLGRLRLRYVERQFNVRLDARVGERTRIARELHDTLLQNLQGVLLKFHAVAEMLSDRPAEAHLLKEAIDQAARAITEGRNAVQALRMSTLAANDLAEQVSALAEQLTANQSVSEDPSLEIQVDGPSRDL